MNWGQFLRILAEDGVSLGESEDVILTEGGERVYYKMLIKGPLWVQIWYDGPGDPVPPRRIRQIANILRLPFDRYIEPNWRRGEP